MKSLRQIGIGLFSLLLLLFSCSPETNQESSPEEKPLEESAVQINPVLVIHGGAGNILRENFTPEQENIYKNALKLALKAGYKILENGGTSSEAVIIAIQTLEADSLFNAGVGAVLTHEKKVSLDASFMDGKTGQAGAVAGVTSVKSPIELAYTIMHKSKHVMLSGIGAEKFAQLNGLTMVDPSYFITKLRLQQVERVIAQEENQEHVFYDPIIKDKKMGTVGAVALDKYGDLAAGTSTGGMTNKKHGRIGDSPIIGAGTFADNATCAVSATGHGEFFIRNVVAYDISARMKYQNSSLKDATQASIDNLTTKKGEGGVIALDKNGNVAMTFNSSGMFRAYAKSNDEIVIELFD